MTSPARQLGHIRPVPPPAPSPGGVESYKRLADVFHQLLAEQELDTLLEQVAATQLPPGVQPFPEELDREIARTKLDTLGITLPRSTPHSGIS